MGLLSFTDLARIIGPDCKVKQVGIRPGEKLHEALITEDESRHALEFKDKFVTAVHGDVVETDVEVPA